MKPACAQRSGFTLLEMMLALALVAILATKGIIVMNDAIVRTGEGTADTVLQDQAQTVLRRIAEAVMSADRESLDPGMVEAPGFTDDVAYRVHLGVQDGEIVWSDPQRIALAADEDAIFWARNPGQDDEMRVVWTNLVAPYLEGEIPDGMDNNGNGLIDERGLSFVFDRNAITIRLTLDRMLGDGQVITKTVETTVTCRNIP